MPPDLSETDTTIFYRLSIVSRAAVVIKTADTIIKNAQARYQRDYTKHVRYEPCFAAVHYVFVERPPLIASAVSRMAFEG